MIQGKVNGRLLKFKFKWFASFKRRTFLDCLVFFHSLTLIKIEMTRSSASFGSFRIFFLAT